MSTLNLSGSSRASSDGSLYDSVNLSGSTRISGDVRCKSFHASGSSRVEGGVYCEGEVHCSGASRFEGSVECRELHVSGACRITENLKCAVGHFSGASRIEGSAECDDARLSGATNIGKNLICKKVTMSGASKICGDVISEYARLSGVSEIGGLLNSEEIEINLNNIGTSDREVMKIKEIGCTKINVIADNASQDHFSVFSIFGKSFSRTGMLSCDTIEGDEVNLCYTKAKTVRGRNVIIGKGCEIEKVEYSETIEVASDSKVDGQTRI